MNTKEYIEKRITELKEHQSQLEQELLAVRAVIGELEVALDPSRLEQEKENKPEEPKKK